MPSLDTVSIRAGSFSCCCNTVLEDLNSLRELRLGDTAFRGVEGEKGVLRMKSGDGFAVSVLDLAQLTAFSCEKDALRYVSEAEFISSILSLC